MAEMINVEMSADEWGQVMMVLQSGVYRVVAPLLQKINTQLVLEIQRQQGTPNVPAAGPRLVDAEGPEAADD